MTKPSTDSSGAGSGTPFVQVSAEVTADGVIPQSTGTRSSARFRERVVQCQTVRYSGDSGVGDDDDDDSDDEDEDDDVDDVVDRSMAKGLSSNGCR